MDESGGTRFEGLNATVRKKRSLMLRRPRPEKPFLHEGRDQSPLTPVSDDFGRVSSDENTDDANAGRKMFNLNHCMSRGSASRVDEDYTFKKTKDGGSSLLYSNGDPGDDTYSQHGSSLRQPGTVQDGVGNDSKLKKVKLKVGGVTRTIQTKTDSHGAYGGGLSTNARALDGSQPRQKSTSQDTSSKDGLSEKKSGLQGIMSRDSPKGSFAAGKGDMGKTPMTNAFEKGGDKSDPTRKSKRVPKRRVSEWFDEDEKDDEIRFLEKLKTSKISGYKDFEEELTNKRSVSRVSKVSKFEKDENVGRSRKKSEQGSEDTAYEVEEFVSDGEAEGKKKQKQRKESSDSSIDTMKGEMTLTTRQRALLSSKDSSAASTVSQIEFPNGLPPAPPRKQKEKLTDVEQQLKKAEAAQKRRMQNEKAARESEAEAIRKILGQDSNRKKREDKIKKRQEELAQEKAAKEQMLAKSTVRVVMGPTGTVVTFPEDMGLPHIFDSKPCSYPPPREQCAGPSCVNPYKYRDSKTKLPLCSLQCYKAIREKEQA